MKPKAESKLLDVEIDGERGLERLKKLGRAILAAPKHARHDQKQKGLRAPKGARS
jgi:hypothetical protein